MSRFEKMQTLVILAAVITGLMIGQNAFISHYAENFIMPFLLLMLYGLFLSVPVKNLQAAFKNLKFLSISTIINFIWTPLLAYGLGALFLSDHPALWLGFILLLVTPCTDWYLIFTSIAKGNLSLSTSILPVNLILQMVLLPVYLLIFSSTFETVSAGTVFESVFLVLVLPFILANITKYLFRNKNQFLKQRLLPFFSSSQIFLLSLAVTAMFASEGGVLFENLDIMILILIPLLLFFVVNFIVAETAGRIFKFSYENLVSLNMTVAARNSPLALGIVIAAFPDEPLVAFVLVAGPLVELPVLALVSNVLLRSRKYR
ncbi:arsenic resistance protein [Corticicoccus populi]|uniref:Arsenic resistance protein n=1 Tax=Corticicoccus populi TaxID=1812821 RepID=A0ABW5WVY8_9STAP